MDWNWFRKNSSVEITDENRPQKVPLLVEHLNDKYGDFEYEKDARALDAEKAYETAMNSVVKKMLSAKSSSSSVLIGGANSGVEVDLFKEFQITAIDLSDVALKKISQKYPEVRIVHGDIQNLPFTDKSFDAYVCMRAIYASNLNIQKALDESFRVARSFLVYSISNGYNIEGKLIKGMYNPRSGEIEEHLPHKHLETIKTFLIRHGCSYEILEAPSEIIVFAVYPKPIDARVLNVVDENGKVIGVETRERIHQKGLLHREVHVWFYTPHGELIFQHRAKDKDTFPNLLDATIGGHVEIGSDYEDTALKEMEEETGVKATKDQLILIETVRSKGYDAATGKANNVLRAVYAYRYNGKLADLKVEEGKAMGFEEWSFEAIFSLSEEYRKRFIPVLLEPQSLSTYSKIQELV